jgi:protein SCO1/2
MIDQEGRPFGSDELWGQVYVANFFFTTCTSICPPLMRSMKSLQERLGRTDVKGIRLVSISVDPERDTPERLRTYAKQLGIDPARWTLLAGESDRLRELLEGGFKVPLGEPPAAGASVIDIAHSGKLVLVDGQSRIRGYYDSDALGLDEVFHRAQHVRDQK